MHKQPWVIGVLLRAKRQEKGLTQRQLATLVGGGFRERDVQHLEDGRRGVVRPERLEQILRALDSDLSLLHPKTSTAPGTIQPFDTQGSPPVRSHQPASLFDLPEARERLQAALSQSRLAIQRTAELLSTSQQLLEPAPPLGSPAIGPTLYSGG